MNVPIFWTTEIAVLTTEQIDELIAKGQAMRDPNIEWLSFPLLKEDEPDGGR